MYGYGPLMRCMSFIGKFAMLSLEKKTKDPRKVQEKLLLSVLKKNKDTEYGRKYGFSEIHSIAEYQRKVPVREYDDFVPYIMRMVKGEENVLVKKHIPHYNRTSAILGPAKYIPLARKDLRSGGAQRGAGDRKGIGPECGGLFDLSGR